MRWWRARWPYFRDLRLRPAKQYRMPDENERAACRSCTTGSARLSAPLMRGRYRISSTMFGAHAFPRSLGQVEEPGRAAPGVAGAAGLRPIYQILLGQSPRTPLRLPSSRSTASKRPAP